MRESRPRTNPERPCADELRCGCGRLVARRVGSGIELRCGRCKRPVVIRIEGEDLAALFEARRGAERVDE
jgi:phage FluMu protein Com